LEELIELIPKLEELILNLTKPWAKLVDVEGAAQKKCPTRHIVGHEQRSQKGGMLG
jgi:hypothetical protein